MDQQFQRALRSRVQLISMATAAPTICFTIRAHAKQQFGTSTIIYALATLPVPPSCPAGVSSRLDSQLSRERPHRVYWRLRPLEPELFSASNSVAQTVEIFSLGFPRRIQ